MLSLQLEERNLIDVNTVSQDAPDSTAALLVPQPNPIAFPPRCC